MEAKSKKKTKKLKPCPFCGSKAKLNSQTASNDPFYKIVSIDCDSCNCTLAYFQNDFSAIIAWNNRVDNEQR